MSLINTFYLLFKSNSDEAAAGLDKVGKKIDEIKKKGAEEEKQEAEQHQNRKRRSEETREQTDRQNNSMERLAQSTASALAAYVSFAAIKSNITNAAELNRQLTIQADLWGQNADQIAAYSALVKANGGSPGAVQSFYGNLVNQLAANGQTAPALPEVMDRLHRLISSARPEIARMYFQQYGINDPGLQKTLRLPDAEYEKQVKQEQELARARSENGPALEAYGTAVDNLQTAFTSLWTVIGGQVLPLVTDFINGLTELATGISKNKAAAVSFFGVLTGFSAIFGLNAIKLAGSFGALGRVLTLIASPIAKITALISALGLVISGAYQAGGWLYRKLHPGGDSDAVGSTAPVASGTLNSRIQAAMKQLMAAGYTKEAASGVVANLVSESSLNTAAVGDNGRAVGIAQWHPDRVAAIKAGTGIDVRSAGFEDQLRALIWEQRSGARAGFSFGTLNRLGAREAGEYTSRRYESPAAADSEAFKRGQAALSIASGSYFVGDTTTASSSRSVNVGTINVHTQATNGPEVARAIREEMDKQWRFAHAQFNDAVSH